MLKNPADEADKQKQAHLPFFCRDTYHEELANEFLGFFDFTNHSLVESLRTFLSQVSLTQDVQEREVVLQHFTKRYLQYNQHLYTSKTFLSEGELQQGVIGRASCRERVQISVVAVSLKKKKKTKQNQVHTSN